MQIIYDGNSYPLKASFGALKKMDELTETKDAGTGLATKFIEMASGGDPVALRDLVFSLNTNLSPSLTLGITEQFLESLSPDELEKLISDLTDFLLLSGLSAMRILKLLKLSKQNELLKSLQDRLKTLTKK